MNDVLVISGPVIIFIMLIIAISGMETPIPERSERDDHYDDLFFSGNHD